MKDTPRIRKPYPGEEAQLAQVHVSAWKETYQGLMPDSFLDSLSVEKRRTIWKRKIQESSENSRDSLSLVALNPDGEIVGFASGGAEREAACRYDGELYALYLLRKAQGHGQGRKLFEEFTALLRSRGYHSMRIWVLEANPTRGFYERMGGELQPEIKSADFGGVSCVEVSYGWTLNP